MIVWLMERPYSRSWFLFRFLLLLLRECLVLCAGEDDFLADSTFGRCKFLLVFMRASYSRLGDFELCFKALRIEILPAC